MTFSPETFYSQRQAALERDIDALLSPSICPINPLSRSPSPDSDLSDHDSLFSEPRSSGRNLRRSSSVYSSASSVYSTTSSCSPSPPTHSAPSWSRRRQSSSNLPLPPKLSIDTNVGRAAVMVTGNHHHIRSSTGYLSSHHVTPTPLPTAYRNTYGSSVGKVGPARGNLNRPAPPPPAVPPPPIPVDMSEDEEGVGRPTPGSLGRRPTRRARSGSRQRSRSRGVKVARDVPKRRGAVKKRGREFDMGWDDGFVQRPQLSRKFSWEM